MKTALTILLLVMWEAVYAGTISGVVTAEGKPEVQSTAAGGAYDSRKFKFAEKVDYAALRDFVVYIEGVVVTNVPASNLTAVVETHRILQKRAMFSPHILPVLVGTTVEWPNNDDIYHNVFSMSETKPFDLGLYVHPTIKQVTFDKPGRVDVFCSIHSRMNCTVLVLENPWYALTDERGHYRISNVPPGKYRLKAWHERVPADSQEITVPESGDVRADFALGINHLPKY